MYLGLVKCVFKVYLNWFSVYIGLVKLNVYLGLFLCIWVLFRVYLELVEVCLMLIWGWLMCIDGSYYGLV